MPTTRDPRTITPGMIYDEARQAAGTARQVLEKFETPREEDPLADLTAAVAEMVRNQLLILRRLDAIERKLPSQPPGSAP